MHDGIKNLIGPTKCKTAPLKSLTGNIIRDADKQMRKWMEHYSELYSRERSISYDALDGVSCLSVMERLGTLPTVGELSRLIDKLPRGKAPGLDDIPPVAIKCTKIST